MAVTRREWLALAAITCAGCKGAGGEKASVASAVKEVDAGPRDQYAADGVYDHFRAEGFFLVNEAGNLKALSAVCTHRECKLKAQPDHTFFCKCHGSRFSEEGKVTHGPATRDLPHFSTIVNVDNHLIVRVTPATFDEG